jgi:hypothetical protein
MNIRFLFSLKKEIQGWTYREVLTEQGFIKAQASVKAKVHLQRKLGILTKQSSSRDHGSLALLWAASD